MRVLFLIPAKTSFLNRDFAATQVVPSVGIASIVGTIQKEFPDVAVLDAFAEKLTLKESLKKIMDFKPDVVAASALTTQIHDAAATAKELKQISPQIRTVAGGPHTSKIPGETLVEFPALDFTIAGEGELPMLELLLALRDGGDTGAIKGVYTLRKGEVVSGGPREFMQDLDSLGFPEWKHFNWNNYCASFRLKSQGCRELLVSINRGCPFNCIFCSKIMGNKIRKRSIPRVIEEMTRDMEKFGANQFLFTDETFTVDRGGVVELCEGIIQKGLHEKVSWICDTRPDMVDDELVALMKRAGCFFMCFGADSVSDEALKYMKKNASAANIFMAIRMCRKHGITTQAAYILGLPADTAESINANARGAVRVDSDFATFSILVPYPGTRIMEMAENNEEGLKLLSKDWRLYGKQLGYAVETKNLKRTQLEKLQRRAYYRYYLRPRKFLNIFKIADVKVIALYFISHMLRFVGFSPKQKQRN